MADERPMYLYNTMGREMQEFVPLSPDYVRMYTCGPTVYSFAHIGNFRSFLTADILRRVLEYNGYQVRQVRNITDVGHLTNDELNSGEDKLEAAAQRAGKTPWEIAAYYTDAFQNDARLLNLEEPYLQPRATEYIESMTALAERLIEGGHAYPSAANVYFDVSSFPPYGRLSGNSVQDLVAGARVEVGEDKQAPEDFALWKVAGPEKPMRWESPWGWGVPGWHLECSAMAFDLLGEQIDIHTGGVDNIFPHHEDEIAQSEAAFGVPFSRYWVHTQRLQLAGDEKMSKSKGNIATVSDLEANGMHPLAYRYFTFQAHYRTPLNFSWPALEAANTALLRIWEQMAELCQSAGPEEINEEGEPYRERFHTAVNRDMDLPGAVAMLHEVLGTKISPGQKLALARDFDRVLGLDLVPMGHRLSAATPEQEALLTKRAEARRERNWAQSDDLRAQLARLHLDVKDTAGGQRWVRRDVLPAQRTESA